MAEVKPQKGKDAKGAPDRPWWSLIRSLQFKAFTLVVVLLVVVTGVGAGLANQAICKVFYDNEYSRTLEWATSLAAGTAGGVEDADRVALMQTVTDLITTHSAAYVAFADESGEIIASGEISDLPERCPHRLGNC